MQHVSYQSLLQQMLGLQNPHQELLGPQNPCQGLQGSQSCPPLLLGCRSRQDWLSVQTLPQVVLVCQTLHRNSKSVFKKTIKDIIIAETLIQVVLVSQTLHINPNETCGKPAARFFNTPLDNAGVSNLLSNPHVCQSLH